MTTKFIGNDKTEFADKYFPRIQSEDSLFPHAMSVSLKSSYTELEHADKLDKKTLQDNFVRRLSSGPAFLKSDYLLLDTNVQPG